MLAVEVDPAQRAALRFSALHHVVNPP